MSIGDDRRSLVGQLHREMGKVVTEELGAMDQHSRESADERRVA